MNDIHVYLSRKTAIQVREFLSIKVSEKEALIERIQLEIENMNKVLNPDYEI